MAWHAPEGLLTRLLGDWLGVAVALAVVLLAPVIMHIFLYRSAARPPTAPTFLLLGPTSSGKTSLVTFLQKQSVKSNSTSEHAPSQTHTSQTSRSVALKLPPSIPLGSNRYRSENDTSVLAAKKTGTPYFLVDTPGHGKLRSTSSLTSSTISTPSLYGVVFVLDAAALADSSTYLTDAAAYLHDTLIQLLKRRKSKTLKKDAKTRNIPVLIAANKQDLFTALPAGTVRERIEDEIQRLRESRRRGVVGVDARDDDVGDEDEELLGTGEKGFTLKSLDDEEGADLRVEILGGSVRGEEAGKGIRRWEEWIGQCL